MAAPSWKWSVSYVAAQDLASGSGDHMMGELHLWTATDWIGLMTIKGTPVVGKFLRKGDVGMWDLSWSSQLFRPRSFTVFSHRMRIALPQIMSSCRCLGQIRILGIKVDMSLIQPIEISGVAA
jgi:hypothetical protein